jgi:hypothetical protein
VAVPKGTFIFFVASNSTFLLQFLNGLYQLRGQCPFFHTFHCLKIYTAKSLAFLRSHVDMRWVAVAEPPCDDEPSASRASQV